MTEFKCCVLISACLVRQLQKLHAARLKISFGSEQEQQQEREIEILTSEVSAVRSCWIYTAGCIVCSATHGVREAVVILFVIG